jgi:hypothetical protein
MTRSNPITFFDSTAVMPLTTLAVVGGTRVANEAPTTVLVCSTRNPAEGPPCR